MQSSTAYTIVSTLRKREMHEVADKARKEVSNCNIVVVIQQPAIEMSVLRNLTWRKASWGIARL